MNMKKIFVISGPSGVGKSTLLQRLLIDFGSIASTTVSHTTRTIRTGERNGKEYHFVSKEIFTKMIADNLFLEHIQYCSNYYGTSLITIQDVLNNYQACIMDLEWEGAFKILHECNIDAKKVGILILPPSLRSLCERLKGRNTEDCSTIQCRFQNAFAAKKIGYYKYVIINKEVEEAYKILRNIFTLEINT